MLASIARLLFALCLSLTVGGIACASETQSGADRIATHAPAGRLNGPAKPTHYTLALTVLPEQDRFSGDIIIQATLSERVEGIYLHGNNLNVTLANVQLENGKRVRASYRQLTPDGVSYVAFGRPVEAQNIALEFRYDAPFDRQLLGLYRVDEDGRSYAFTQFESIFARKAFVSFDEPEHKTPFDISLTVRAEHVAVANTEVVSTEQLDDGMKRVTFATTEKLPTYLVALAVGNLDVVEAPPIAPNGRRKTPLPLRGIAAHGKGADLAYALANTGALLVPLENYFDQAYPYSKLDIIAVPDFQSGAMENAGAITFRERLLLLKPDAPVTQRQAYASVMAHELAHMWFGDLVTMPWWDDIWLNESFATWMSYKAVREFDPGARPELKRLRRLRSAKKEDGLQSARQIREPVTDHHGIVAAFDGITYAKGGAVLNMLENYIGEETFRDAVRDHMRRFAWGSADVNDFIASLVRASEPAIETSFKSFLFQNGLPRVAQSAPCSKGKIELTQSRYVPLGTKSGLDQTWTFPVCMKYGRDGEVHEQCDWVSDKKTPITFKGEKCPDWVTLDAQYAGYYHWAMDDADYIKLHQAAAPLSAVEWESIIDSAYAGLADGSMSVDTAWKTLEPLANSPYKSVALAPIRALEYWLDTFGDEPKLASSLRTVASGLYAGHDAARAFSPAFIDGLGSDEERVFYQQVLDFMAHVARDANTRVAALKSVQTALTDRGVDTSKLAGLTLETALVVAVQDGDKALRERLLAAFFASRDAQFRRAALNALGSTRDDALATRLRDDALAGKIRTNEIERLLNAQFDEPNSRNGAWRFVRDNYAALIDIMPPRHASRLPARMAPFCDAVMLEPMEALFRPRVSDVPGGERELNKALEAMSHCAARSVNERAAVRARFSPGMRR